MAVDLRHLLTGRLGLDPSAFEGATIVVTGAGGGIGFHTARAFATLRGQVVIAELAETGRDAERAIRSEGGEALFVETDVAVEESVARLVDTVRERYGPVDVLVNNAIFIREGAVQEMDVGTWDRTIAVNLRGAFLTCRAVLPGMLDRRSGAIVSLVSTEAMPGLAAYIASKQGLAGFSDSLAAELSGTGVRVLAVGPGMVDTPGIRSVADGLAPRLGLTPEQFLHLSLHADYPGPMPAEHAAAAIAYAVLRLADEEHGQTVTGYEILERAGLIGRPAPALDREASQAAQPTGAAPGRARPADDVAGVPELARQLLDVLVATEAEFGRLPAFVRPIARRGFKGKCGWSVADWQRVATGLAAHPSAAPAGLSDRLERLAAYYRGVPRETERFTRDSATLAEITALSNRRAELVEALRGELA